MEVRYAIRTFLRVPGFTAAVVITLALGIGANTAIFSLVHTLVLKPPAFRDPDRLITVWDTYLPQYAKLGISSSQLAAYEEPSDLFDSTAWYRYVSHDLTLSAPGVDPLEVHAALVSDRLFLVLGVAPFVGRAFTAADSPRSLLLSYAVWKNRFGGNPAIAGKVVRLGDQEYVILGVMPPSFAFPQWADVWLPPGTLMGDELTNPVRHALGFVARLGAGTDVRRVRLRLDALGARLRFTQLKTSAGFGVTVSSLQDDLTAPVRPALWMLLGAVALVLLIACANVANLLLARSSGRAKEMAVRAALGAGRARIARQLFTESLLLALLGCAAGLPIAHWSLAVFATVPTPIDSTVLLFAVVVSILTGVAFGLAPLAHLLRSDFQTTIKTGSLPGGGSTGTRNALVVTEFALALILLACAGILGKSLVLLMHVDPGFRTHGLLTMRIPFSDSQNPDALFHRMEAELRKLPGVTSVAAVNSLPLIATEANSSRFNVPGSPLINPDALPIGQRRFINPEYFATMGIPIHAGREFTDRDLDGDNVVVNETMARRFWPGQDAVGQKFITGPWGPKPTWSTIVGVVGDVKQFGLDSEPTYDFYLASLFPRYVVVRTSGSAAGLAGAARDAIRAVDADLPVAGLRTMDDVLDASSESRRWILSLVGAFAALALVLALVGIYGVIAWSVAQRTREIGIRMALGARGGQVRASVVFYGVKLCAVGTLLGLAGALAMRRVLAGFVFGVSTADPLVLGGVALAMLLVAILASYVPARRASRVDPLVTLRIQD